MPPPFDPTRAAPQASSSPLHLRQIRRSITQRNTQNKNAEYCIGILYFIFGSCVYFNNLKNDSINDSISNSHDVPLLPKDCTISKEEESFPIGHQINQSARVIVMTCTIEHESGPASKKFKVDGSVIVAPPCELEIIARKAFTGSLLPPIDWSLPSLKTLDFKNDSSFKSFVPPLEIKDTLRAVLTEDIAPMLGILIKYHALFLPNDETLANINPERFKMEFRNVALIYYILEK